MNDRPQASAAATRLPLLEARELSKRYRAGSAFALQTGAVWGLGDQHGGTVDFTAWQGQSVAIVGASGSGKSTLLGMMLGLGTPTSGTVHAFGRRVVPRPRGDRLLWLRRRTGIVFQDPYAAFNPRRTVGQSVAEPLVAIAAPGDHRLAVEQMLERVQLPRAAAGRYPHEFSGGERQRIALARALVHRPQLLVADEPVSAVDVLVRASILELIDQLRTELGLTLIVVTHDLSIVPRLAEQVVVMQHGIIVDRGDTHELFAHPQAPHTRELLAALPRLP